jgi:HPt (histidine-containing phosphotransfer) domain-containing protein
LPIAPDVSLPDRYQSRKVQTIGALERLLRNRRPSEMNIKDLLDQLHKLAGTAGYFGDNALGEAAAQLEYALRNAKRSQIRNILAQQASQFGLAAQSKLDPPQSCSGVMAVGL